MPARLLSLQQPWRLRWIAPHPSLEPRWGRGHMAALRLHVARLTWLSGARTPTRHPAGPLMCSPLHRARCLSPNSTPACAPGTAAFLCSRCRPQNCCGGSQRHLERPRPLLDHPPPLVDGVRLLFWQPGPNALLELHQPQLWDQLLLRAKHRPHLVPKAVSIWVSPNQSLGRQRAAVGIFLHRSMERCFYSLGCVAAVAQGSFLSPGMARKAVTKMAQQLLCFRAWQL